MHTTTLHIYSLHGSLFEGPVISVSLPTDDGEITVLKDHAPIATSLHKGIIKITTPEKINEMSITSGFAHIDGASIILLVNE